MSAVDRLLAEAEQEDADNEGSEPQPSPSPPTPTEPAAEADDRPSTSHASRSAAQSTLSFAKSGPQAYLKTLNESQHAAVTAPERGSMQILAGPGSGAFACSADASSVLTMHVMLSRKDQSTDVARRVSVATL